VRAVCEIAAPTDEQQLVPTGIAEEPGASLPRVAMDGDGMCVDRGGGFGRVHQAFPPLIWKVGSCL